MAGAGMALLLAVVLVTHKFQAFPSYKVGDIAEADIRSSQELWLEDLASTQAKREQVMTSVPAVFDSDASLLAEVESDIQQTFARGREILQQYEKRERTKLPSRLDYRKNGTLWREVKGALGDTPRERVLQIFFQEAFSDVLRDKLLNLYREAVQVGVVQSRDSLLRNQQGSIRLHNLKTGEETTQVDIYLIRDVSQARSVLRQHQLEFSELNAADRREVVSYLEEKILPSVVYNMAETDRRRQEAARRVEVVQQHIKPGRVIVRQGDEITPPILNIIGAISERNQPKEVVSRYIGIFLLISMLSYAVWRYFNRFQNRHRKIRNHFVLFSLVLFLSLIVSRLLLGLSDLMSENLAVLALKDSTNIYYSIPFAFGCILITLLVDTNIAILFLVLNSALIGIYTGSIHLTGYVILGGFAAIYAVKQYRDRTAILKAGLIIGVVNIIAATAIDQLIPSATDMNVLMVKVTGGFVGGILAAMFASLLLPVLERLFNITTDIRLLELSNLDSPILRRMAVEAPGTYHHSIIMGTLAETAAEAIGANALLVRVASYYHDIGKIAKPQYFVENQVYVQNKHESLSPHMSCLVIASHVKEGLELADQLGLPNRIRDMIPQHHGNRVMTYFYQKAKSDPRNQDQEIKEEDFRYPGPKPQTKEAALLMIADAVEAASRTLTDPTPAQIQGMVKRLIDNIIADGQFDECDISLKELDLISKSLLKVICGMFHHRIDYPGYDFSKTDSEAATASAAAHSSIQ